MPVPPAYPDVPERLLAQWQAKGWIRGERRTWRLCDAHQLRQLAAPGTRTF